MLSRKVQALILATFVVIVNSAILGEPTIVLSIGFVVCAVIWATREWQPVPHLVSVAAVAVVVLCLHFTEELVSGFAREFPELFGKQWSVASFITFNVSWLIIFTLCIVGVSKGRQVAFLGVLFLALIATLANGVGHIVLSLLSGRLFPGTYTAPLLIAVGATLVRALKRASSRALI